MDYEIWYEGDLSTRCIHLGNGDVIVTDAPKDNQGKGERFSPTDLLAVSLGSCMLTIMGILARKLNVDLKGTKVVVSKQMQNQPVRKIAKITLSFYCPHPVGPLIAEKLQRAAETCPVHHSLHPDLIQEIHYHWGTP
jgi:putative redox protein